MKVNPHKSSLGMDANIMALLCYIAAFVLSWIPVIKWVAWAAPLVIFLVEKQSPFVKFHAMQALLLEAVNFVFAIILAIIGAIVAAVTVANPYNWVYGRGLGAIGAVGIIGIIIGIALTVLAIVAMVKAYGYFEYKLPVVGSIADKISKKGATL